MWPARRCGQEVWHLCAYETGWLLLSWRGSRWKRPGAFICDCLAFPVCLLFPFKTALYFETSGACSVFLPSAQSSRGCLHPCTCSEPGKLATRVEGRILSCKHGTGWMPVFLTKKGKPQDRSRPTESTLGPVWVVHTRVRWERLNKMWFLLKRRQSRGTRCSGWNPI